MPLLAFGPVVQPRHLLSIVGQLDHMGGGIETMLFMHRRQILRGRHQALRPGIPLALGGSSLILVARLQTDALRWAAWAQSCRSISPWSLIPLRRRI